MIHCETVESRVVGGWVLSLLLATAACSKAKPTPVPAPVDPAPPPAVVVAAEEPPPPPPAAPNAPRVVLVTIDGVRWEDAFSGLMPNLERLAKEKGVMLGGGGCERDARATGPNFVSFPGYAEIFTGKPSKCGHNYCPRVKTDTIVDETKGAVFSSWSKIADAATRHPKSLPMLSAGSGGANIPSYPGHGDYRPDVYTTKAALRYLEAEKPAMLVIGLGDPDEHAHRGDLFSYRRSTHRADDFLVELDHTLTKLGGNAAVLVTTDHGRSKSIVGHGADYPESQRVFFAAFGTGIAHRGVACTSEALKLTDVPDAIRAMQGRPAHGPLAAEIIEAWPSRSVR